MKEQFDNRKQQSMQDLTVLIKQIENEVKDKKNRLAPEIKKLRTYRQRFTDIEKEYNAKKQNYESVQGQLEVEKERWEKDMGNAFTDYKEAESKFHQNNV